MNTTQQHRDQIAADLEIAIENATHIGAFKQTEDYRAVKMMLAGMDTFMTTCEPTAMRDNDNILNIDL